MRSRKALLFSACLFFFQKSNGQTNISGQVNNYYEVTTVDLCNNLVALPYIPAGISSGDRVLLIQHSGATIDQADAPSFGTITSEADAGNYEILTVQSVVNNIITFDEVIERSYDAAGKVQLVRIPQYSDVTIAGTVSALPWNGKEGGVVILEASGTITFSSNIDVGGMGFSGGNISNQPSCYGGGTGYSGYRCLLADECGGNKGNGIADDAGFELGRGPLANGGGGGNDNNTGGGGGANAGAGGVGGERLNTVAGDCIGNSPGLGGNALSYSNSSNKIFFGGGGGSGDDNSNESTSGGNGGGMVILIANDIAGNGFSIFADGQNQILVSQRDGGGGGGAAGTVLLSVNSVSSPLNISLTGGKGGNVDNGNVADSCFGPGGGGGGGMLWVSGGSISPNIILNNAGGAPGITSNGNAPVICNGLSNGATAGSPGSTLTGLLIPESTTPYTPLTLSVSNDTLICLGEAATLVASGTGTGTLNYEWSDGGTGSSHSVSPAGFTNYTVTLTDGRGCSITDEVSVDVTSITVSASVSPQSIIQGNSVNLDATAGFDSYQWTPVKWLINPAIQNPVATPDSTVTYCVEAENSLGCADTSCITVYVTIPPSTIHIPTAFTPNNDGLNDKWELLINACYSITEMFVVNRWGEEVWRYTTYGNFWDGTKSGVPVEIGSYVYYIVGVCSERNEVEIFQGTVAVLR